MKVAIYAQNFQGDFGNKRALYIANSFQQGLRTHGVESQICRSFGGVVADLAVAYGWVHRDIFQAYRDAGKHYIFWDLGYFNRRPAGASNEGHHRMAVDSWDTATSLPSGCPTDRFDALGVKFLEPRPGRSQIMVAGMSEKAGWTHGYKFDEWEQRAARQVFDLVPEAEVVMRPKPNKRAMADEPVEQALERTKLVVTHHSNVAVDAMVAGVPHYAVKGVGSLLSPKELTAEFIREPAIAPLEDRRRILVNLAYAQWTPAEMRSGEAWDNLRYYLRTGFPDE